MPRGRASFAPKAWRRSTTRGQRSRCSRRRRASPPTSAPRAARQPPRARSRAARAQPRGHGASPRCPTTGAAVPAHRDRIALIAGAEDAKYVAISSGAPVARRSRQIAGSGHDPTLEHPPPSQPRSRAPSPSSAEPSERPRSFACARRGATRSFMPEAAVGAAPAAHPTASAAAAATTAAVLPLEFVRVKVQTSRVGQAPTASARMRRARAPRGAARRLQNDLFDPRERVAVSRELSRLVN